MNTLKNWITHKRWYWKFRNYKNYNHMMNNLVKVEQELFDIANGRLALPTKEDCRRLARKLCEIAPGWNTRKDGVE